jgi:amidase
MRAGDVSSEELTRSYLERIAKYNGDLNAVVALDDEGALKTARERDNQRTSGEAVGVLHGLPMTVKDALEVAGIRSTAGIPKLKDHVPTKDAEMVARIRRAGAVILGKSNMPTANADFQTSNPIYGRTNNPWDHDRTPGGSAGGAAAAVSAGLCSMDVGSEIGGSLRTPAHFTGIYGHKSSFRTMPLNGHLPPGPDSPGCEISEIDMAAGGGMARSASDLEPLLRALAGPTRAESSGLRLELPAPRARNLSDFRVAAWLDDPYVPLDSEVRTALRALTAELEAAGVRIDRGVPIPVGLEESHEIFASLLYGAFGGDPHNSTITPKSTFYFMRSAMLHPRGEARRAGKFIRQSHKAWLSYDARRFALRAGWAQFFEAYDILLMPVTPTVAPPHHNKDHDRFSRTYIVNGKPRPYDEQIAWCGVANVAGSPATVALAGFGASGLPVGVQMMGPLFADLTTIEFARRIEERIGGYTPPPNYSVSVGEPSAR